MSNWIHSTLEQICVPDKGAIISGPFGSNISSKFFVSQGVPVIRGNNLTLGKEKFIDNGFAYITPEKAEELNCYALKNDLVFTAAGTLGQVGVLTGDLRYEKYVISNKQLRARIDSSKVDLLYAYYWYSSPWMQQYFITNNKGSTVPLVTLSELKSAPITYPESIEEQRKIASIFDDITTKIDLNTRLCSELEAMAKTLYDYWFVQFDFPDENGKPYRTSGGAMEWCQKLGREVPKGWKAKRVSELTKVITGKEDANFSTADGEYKFFTCGQETLCCDTPAFTGKAVLIAGNGDFNVKHYTGSFNAYQRTYVLIPNEDKYYAAMFIAAKDTIQSFRQGSNGSIVKFITKGDVENITLLSPTNDDLLQRLNGIIEQIELFEKENDELIKLRDWLLPMLMNEQAQVEK